MGLRPAKTRLAAFGPRIRKRVRAGWNGDGRYRFHGSARAPPTFRGRVLAEMGRWFDEDGLSAMTESANDAASNDAAANVNMDLILPTGLSGVSAPDNV
jgi:hypothetical protein